MESASVWYEHITSSADLLESSALHVIRAVKSRDASVAADDAHRQALLAMALVHDARGYAEAVIRLPRARRGRADAMIDAARGHIRLAGYALGST